MGRKFKYVLPFPPTVNTYWRQHGHTIHISPKGKRYKEQVAANIGRVANTGAFLKATAVYLRPDNVRRDLDNYKKALYDALKEARVFQDDCQVVHIDAKWQGYETIPGGRVDPFGLGSVTIELEEV